MLIECIVPLGISIINISGENHGMQPERGRQRPGQRSPPAVIRWRFDNLATIIGIPAELFGCLKIYLRLFFQKSLREYNRPTIGSEKTKPQIQ